MESDETPIVKDGTHIVLVLGKFRVIERNEFEMKVALGGSTTMTVSVKPYMDVKAGDLLTLYTEVLFNAKSQ